MLYGVIARVRQRQLHSLAVVNSLHLADQMNRYLILVQLQLNPLELLMVPVCTWRLPFDDIDGGGGDDECFCETWHF